MTDKLKRNFSPSSTGPFQSSAPMKNCRLPHMILIAASLALPSCGKSQPVNSIEGDSSGGTAPTSPDTGGTTAFAPGSGGETTQPNGSGGGEAMAPSTPDKVGPFNILFILADDLGVMDIGSYNPDSFYDTPNLDRLAEEGMRFTDGYAANPVCSPTRFSIMTGKYPTRGGATNYFGGNHTERYRPALYNQFMAAEEFTVAEALRANGYRTAFLGKWHLGTDENLWPEHQGFEVNIGGWHAGAPDYTNNGYFSPYHNPRLPDGPEGEHLPARLTDEAIGLLDQFQDEPFYIQLSYYSVHAPLVGREDLVAKYEERSSAPGPAFASEEQVWLTNRPREVRVKQDHVAYAAMVEAMDEHIGRLLAHLEKLGLDKNTVVIFSSDNGGLSTSEGHPTSNLPYRGGKGWVYEGGIREPYIFRVPGVTSPGSVNSTPITSTDFYPTMLTLTQTDPLPEQHKDGIDLWPLLSNTGTADRDALFWHYPHYSNQGGFPGGAVRMGKYKLVERFEDGRIHLYDLESDQENKTI